MTHDHQIDFSIVAAALARDDFAGVGLIGSATKRARFVRRLGLQRLEAAAIGRLICPIGIPGIGGKLPAEIAIAVAAQILQLAPAETSSEEDPASEQARNAGVAGSKRAGARDDASSNCRDCAAACQPVKVQA